MNKLKKLDALFDDIEALVGSRIEPEARELPPTDRADKIASIAQSPQVVRFSSVAIESSISNPDIN